MLRYIAAFVLAPLPFAANAGTNAVACVPSDPANVKFVGMGWQITKPGIYTLTCPTNGAM